MNLEEKILDLIARVQHLDRAKLSLEATFEELNIDSLDGINLVFAIEDEFNISIPDHIAQQMKSVRQVVETLQRALADPEAFKQSLTPTPSNPAGAA